MASTKILFTLVIGYALGGPLEDAWTQRLQDTFKMMDTIKDGVYCLDEVAMDNSATDTNGDGYMDFAELQARVAFVYRKKEMTAPYGQASVMQAYLHNWLLCFTNGGLPVPTSWSFLNVTGMDVNGDHLLSKEEFINYHTKVLVNNLKGQAYKCNSD